MRMPVSWMNSLSESFSQPLGTPLAMNISFVWNRDYTGGRPGRDKKRDAESDGPSALLPLPGEFPLGLFLLGRRRRRRLIVLGRRDERDVRRLVSRGFRRGLGVDDRQHAGRLLHPALGLVGEELQLGLDVGTLLEHRGLGRGVRVGLPPGSGLDLGPRDLA